MAVVELRAVSKAFAAVEVLHRIDLAIQEGEFVVLLGPSGCGKSTLLRVVAGLEGVSVGDVLIDGRSVTNVDPKDRNIAMVFQNYALYPHMTVRRNLGFALRLRGEGDAAIAERIGAAGEVLGLSDLLDRYPRQLSGGQRQRVAMGRAMVRDPRVFLFDEPLSNLDAQLRVQMRVEIKGLQQRLGSTVIYVTHDQIEAMTMADRIIVMRGGKIEQIASPLEIYDQPVNTFVASFIGSPAINFLSGRITVENGTAAVSVDGGHLPVPGIAQADVGRKVKLGVRPEHIDLTPDRGLDLHVEATEPVGREILIHGVMADGARLCVGPGRRPDIRAGEMIRILPHPGQLHVFDAETGSRL